MGQSGSTHHVREPAGRHITLELSEEEDAGGGSSSSSDDENVDCLANATRTSVHLQVTTPRSERLGNGGGHDRRRGGTKPKTPVIKNVLTEDWDGAEVTPRTVQLHVYDIKDFASANQLLNFALDEITIGGAFHAGVEVFGNEWSYGQRGVKCEAPRTAEGHVYRCTIPLGCTKLTTLEVATVLHELCQTWHGADYDLFSRNCCNFAAEFCRRLEVVAIPAWVDRFARFVDHGRTVAGQVRGVFKDITEALVGHDPQQDTVIPLPGSGEGSRTIITVRGEEVSMISLDCAGQDQGAAGKASAGPSPPIVDQNEAPAEQGDAGQGVLATTVAKGTAGDPGRDAPESCSDADRAVYPVGAAVEYRSESLGGWIPARVLAVHAPSRLYDLDCKPHVPPDRIRWPEASGIRGQSLKETHAGSLDAVQNSSAIAYDRLGATVVLPMAAYPREGHDPRPSQNSSAGCAFPVGSTVEYHSATNGRWIVTKVVAFHEQSGLYDLECRADAEPEKIRWPHGVVVSPRKQSVVSPRKPAGRAEEAPAPVGVVLSPTRKQAAPPEDAAAPAGAVLSPCKQSTASPRKQAGRAEDAAAPVGVVLSPCKQSVSPRKQAGRPEDAAAPVGVVLSPCKQSASSPRKQAARPEEATAAYSLSASIRKQAAGGRPEEQPSPPTGTPGAVQIVLDYTGQSNGLSCNGDGAVKTYEAPKTNAAAHKQAFPVGAAVEYKSTSRNYWMPAKVIGYDDTSGLYDLDCRPSADPQRIRWPGQQNSGLLHASDTAPLRVRAHTMDQDAHDADGKPQMPPELLRQKPVGVSGAPRETVTASRASPPASLSPTKTKSIPSASPTRRGCGTSAGSFPVGAAVEYESSSHGQWVPARVIRFHAALGVYDLDCRPGAPAGKIRWPRAPPVVANAAGAADRQQTTAATGTVESSSPDRRAAAAKVTVVSRPSAE